MGAMASQIASLTIVYSTVCSGADQKISKLRVTGLCVGNSPVTGEFPTQMANNAENVFIWWRHHAEGCYCPMGVYTVGRSAIGGMLQYVPPKLFFNPNVAI